MKTTSIFKLKALLLLFAALYFGAAESQNIVYNSQKDNGRRQFRYSDSFTDYEVQAKGDITVTDDDKGIKSISPGGYLKISKKTFGNKRSLVIESSASGKLSYNYYEGNRETPFDPEGKAWLADVLLDVIRMSGIDAEGRTKRIYQKSGINGFLDEVDQISSNSVSGLYFDALLDNFDLNESEAIAICSSIASHISSNSERGRIYRKYSKVFLRTNNLAAAYFESVSKLSSNTERGSVLRSISDEIDFNDSKVTEAYFSCVDNMESNTEKGSVLRNVEKTQKLSEGAYVRMLMSVQKFSSNTEMGSVMRSLDHLNLKNEKISEAWFNTIDKMSSNTEAGSTLRFVISHYELSIDNYLRLLNSVKKLSSNTEMGSVMRSLNNIDLSDETIREAYFVALNSFSSNTEAGSVLRYTYKNHTLNEAAWTDLFISTGKLSSNTEMGSVLRGAIPKMPASNAIADDFTRACNKFSSNTEHGRTLSEYTRSHSLTKYACIKILESTRKISSNTDKGQVLKAVANTEFINDPEVKEAYMDTARTLTSDSEYRNAVDEIVNH